LTRANNLSVAREIITAAFGIGSELGQLVEIAAVTGARVSQIANLRVADLQADRHRPAFDDAVVTQGTWPEEGQACAGADPEERS
jgi:hypothetical protein